MIRLSEIIDKFTCQSGKLFSVLTILLVLATASDVFMRYIFHAGSVAIQEAQWHLFSLIFLLGSAYTLHSNEHVRVDVFYSRLSLRHKAIIDFLGCILFLLPFCIFVIYTSLPFVISSYQTMETSSEPGGLAYRFLIKAALPLGFSLLLIQALSLSIKSFYCILGKD